MKKEKSSALCSAKMVVISNSSSVQVNKTDSVNTSSLIKIISDACSGFNYLKEAISDHI